MYSVKTDLRQLKNKRPVLYQDIKLIKKLEQILKKKTKEQKENLLLQQLNLF